ncbi:sulfatase-like hydrolase/transferase [Nocardioides sp. JQ2195]|uniref:alkaline phosphatase family protein n=1 Tax=Nocardioides sp. JQ2195 TaxID=2592334 RepID=UPI00143EE5F0|nr:alkaline phosphatase family protein [Nocardioides sp. JQ2195]QIX26016.1 sulfatase-like hydrolase/transferase [Nocardioides sp. JQ2195]
MRSTPLVRACSVVLGLLLAASGCSTSSDAPREQNSAVMASSSGQPGAETAATSRYVLAISVDGLNRRAITKLGKEGAPNFHRLIRRGASTLNARTELERTITLPNHTGMLTGRRVDKDRGGHGVFFNDDNGRTVHDAAGHHVSSVFREVHAHGRKTALFASKTKFRFFKRSWPASVDTITIDLDNARLVDRTRADLVAHPHAFTFLHLSLPDVVGHAKDFMSRPYLRAVRSTDKRLGELLRTIRHHTRLREGMTVILTADHGGPTGSGNHGDMTRRANYQVPFIMWGAGVTKGADLYDLNPAYRNPGKDRRGYAAERQPIRNGDVANVALTMLGMSEVRGSEHDVRQDLRP